MSSENEYSFSPKRIEVTTLASIPLSERKEPGKVWFTSIHKLKGPEPKAVFIVDFRFSGIDDELARRIFHVGCSQANAYLQGKR